MAPISHGSGYLFVPTWLAGGVNVLEPRFEAGRVLDPVASPGGYVFGMPHPRRGETPVAQVVVEDGAAVTEQDIIEACRQRLGLYRKPASVLLSAQPLARKLLREPYRAAAESRIGGT